MNLLIHSVPKNKVHSRGSQKRKIKTGRGKIQSHTMYDSMVEHTCVCVCLLLSHVQLFRTPWTIGLLCPQNFQGKNTGVGCHSLLQGIFPAPDRSQVSCIAVRFFTISGTRETQILHGLCTIYGTPLEWRSHTQSSWTTQPWLYELVKCY